MKTAGCKGIKTAVSGRLGGADMARTELTSNTDLQKQIQHTEKLALRYGSTRAKFFQQNQLRKGANSNVIT